MATDPIWRMAEKAMRRCSHRDWTEALVAARSVVEEARTGLPPGTPKEKVAVLVALRVIEVWMRQER